MLRHSVVLIGLVLSTSALAITDRVLLKNLLAMEEHELAVGVHYQLAERENSYAAWKNIILMTVYQSTQRDAAYQNTYRAAVKADEPQLYRDFLTLKEQPTLLSRMALHAIYEHVQKQDSIPAYGAFMREYPESVEAAEALLRIHGIAFANAEKANDTAVYDAFVQQFPDAEQAPAAIERAYALAEQRWLAVAEQSTDLSREKQARLHFNQGLAADRDSDRLTATRHFRFLNHFMDTEVYTEYVNREERKEWRKAIGQHQQAQQQLLSALRQDVQTQTSELQTALKEQTVALQVKLDEQTQAVTQTIEQQNQLLLAEIRAYHRFVKREQEQVLQQGMLGSALMVARTASVFLPPQLGMAANAVISMVEALVPVIANPTETQRLLIGL